MGKKTGSHWREKYSRAELLATGAQRSFSGTGALSFAFPIGGIGTGTVSIGGRGELRDWEIFNRPGKGKRLPYTFLALQLRAAGRKQRAKVLESRHMPPLSNCHGLPPGLVSGLPRFEKVVLKGTYPFCTARFSDPDVPLKVAYEAFNPLIPMNANDSGLPVMILEVTLRNPGRAKIAGAVAFNLLNPIGLNGRSMPGNRRHSAFGRNVNEWIDEGQLRGLKMTSRKYPDDHQVFGSMALVTSWEDVTYTTHWQPGGWWDDVLAAWEGFRDTGRMDDNAAARETPDAETDVGCLGLCFELGAGQSVRLPFVMSWHFPTRVNEWNSEEAVRGKKLRNFYASQFEDAWDVARYTVRNMERLTDRTRLFERSFFRSKLPSYVLEAVSSQISTIRTNTCFRLEDGSFHGFEGSSTEIGSCPMNCTHVWNYEQTLAHLFPALERTVRRTDYLCNIRPDDSMAFRTLLPTGLAQWGFKPAADGQMGCVMKLYREWLQSGDVEFVRELWPAARRSLEFAWKHWDADGDGLMEGEQHNTYDIEFHGPNPMMSFLYLGALAAGAKLADVVGDVEAKEAFEQVLERGRKNIESLWNGSYYIQKVMPPGQKTPWTPSQPEPRYQFGDGCLSDQLLGQWFAEVTGLGHLASPKRVRKALASVFASNWKPDLKNHDCCQRVYAVEGEPGLLICSWPKGGRPVFPFTYADEVWTGIEYQVAAHLIYEGMVEEGLAIVKGIRERHDGCRRSPWNEPECGDHYARAMASWSVLTALSGCRYSAPDAHIAFQPRINRLDFNAFFTAGTAWGVFSQKIDSAGIAATLDVRFGQFGLGTIGLGALPGGSSGARQPDCRVRLNKKACLSTATAQRDKTLIILAEPLTLNEGDKLYVSVRTTKKRS